MYTTHLLIFRLREYRFKMQIFGAEGDFGQHLWVDEDPAVEHRVHLSE